MICDNILPLPMKKSENVSLFQALPLSSNILQHQIKIHCNIHHWAASLGNTRLQNGNLSSTPAAKLLKAFPTVITEENRIL